MIQSPRRTTARTGFTLIEVAVSLAILSVITLAMGSVVLLTASAAPTGRSIAEGTTTAQAGVQQLAADAAMATAITSGNARSIAFTVPDRNGDSSPDTLSYSWSGTPGDPLLLSFNGGTHAVVVDGVRDLSLSYQLVPVSTTTTTAPVEGPETLLTTYDPASYGTSTISLVASVGQAFHPTLPAGATAWSITKVRFRARTAAPVDGSVTAELRAADSFGLPKGPALWSATVAESSLSATFAWRELTVANVKDLSPSQNAVLLLKYGSGLSAANIGYVSGLSGLTFPMITAPATLVWVSVGGSQMAHAIYGTVTATSTAVTTRKYLDRITISLRAGDDRAPRVESQVRVLCRPEVR